MSSLHDEIDIIVLVKELYKRKWVVIASTTIATILGLIYAFILPNVYESKSLLVETESSTNISRSLQGYAGLAGFAGINLPSGPDKSNSGQAIQKISSLSFFENNIKPNIFLPDLMAMDSWDSETNEIIYNSKIYDVTSDSWVRKYSYPKKQIPSSQESFKVFKKHLYLNQDKKTGFITLSVKHQSPHIAKKWSDLIIDEVNNFYREKDKTESIKAVTFLNEQIASTNLSEVKEVISELLKEETQKLSLIEANQAYVFDFIDPPAAMEKESDPNRSLIFIISLFLGIVLGIFIALIRYYSTRKTNLN